ncbi:MAG TPA: pyrroline-5-carboxylate reductase [Thermomicrobiales bacterium]|nr:pyrroline-5-carboxylate reductase [Thermomicrobiales bacterium]HRA47521.1 pyrroline-5-carboxylate reductase [Thermomicrobiales bacterium]
MDDTQAVRVTETVGFVGAGVMAESMIAGMLARQAVQPAQIIASHPREARRAAIAQRFGIRTEASNLDVAIASDIIFLTVKPQALSEIMPRMAEVLRPEQVVVSIAAGATIALLQNGLRHDAIARVMPNTPAQIGEGMMVWTATPAVTNQHRIAIQHLLAAMGEELFVDEEKYVDMATALSGTGPTYVFLMMEALIDAGVHMGFPRRIAEQIVLQTVSGSVDFARSSGKHMAELRNMVTSPGGTSAEAIYQMEKGSLRTVFSKAVYAAYQRTETLAREQAKRLERKQ